MIPSSIFWPGMARNIPEIEGDFALKSLRAAAAFPTRAGLVSRMLHRLFDITHLVALRLWEVAAVTGTLGHTYPISNRAARLAPAESLKPTFRASEPKAHRHGHTARNR